MGGQGTYKELTSRVEVSSEVQPLARTHGSNSLVNRTIVKKEHSGC